MSALVKSIVQGRMATRLAARGVMVVIAGLASGSLAAGPVGDAAKGQEDLRTLHGLPQDRR